MQKAFDWTFQRIDLLSELIDVLSGTIDEWNTFISLNGDVGYFSDLDEFPRSTNSDEFRELGCPGSSLRNIKQTFEKLKTYRQRLESLTESLSRNFEAVRGIIILLHKFGKMSCWFVFQLKLRLSLECNQATEQASFTSTFLIWVRQHKSFSYDTKC